MSAYLFQIELPETNSEIEEIIPAHRDHISKLISEGRIVSYSVAMNGGHIWCVISAEDETEAMELVSGFPLRRHFSDVSCHLLLFHNTMPASIPGISLN